MTQFYSSVQDVINYTGIGEQSFAHLDTQAKLEAQVETWLIQTKSLMDKITDRDFHQELEEEEITEIDNGLHNIALRIAANMVLQAQIRRQTDIISQESDLPRLLQSSIITENIKAELEEYKEYEIEQNDFSLFMRRVRNRSELK